MLPTQKCRLQTGNPGAEHHRSGLHLTYDFHLGLEPVRGLCTGRSLVPVLLDGIASEGRRADHALAFLDVAAGQMR